ncbi:F-box protein At5g07610-like [Phragmites australis]|uniref:F-box protein At5g07610-like n=1 Tax=Phragmites australis TaxID=29695 RepID=UPI002D79BF81|nr:F-box protein At5g07610-like [Phragmites australis]
MPRRVRFSELPDDLVAGILARLPPRQVTRARFVCRRWRALTTDHHFLRTALAFSRRAGQACSGGFFLNEQFGIRHQYFPFPFPLDRDHEAEDGLAAAPTPDLAFIPNAAPSANPGGGSGNVHVSSSCNGLLLLLCWPPHGQVAHYICNPLTRELAPIPIPNANGLPHCLNLAFDPSISRHYKVVALGYMYGIHVYSSETRHWRTAIHRDRSDGLFVGIRSLRGVFWNGSIVWTVAHSLIRFVIDGEYLTVMPMPPKKKKGWICAYIGESGGHLQMIGYTKEEKLTACFDVLEMQGDQSEWLLLYRIDLGRVKELYPGIERPTWDTQWHQHKIIDYLALSPVYVVRGTGDAGQRGVLMFSVPGKIMSYNMEDQRISVIQEVMSSGRDVLPPYRLEHPWCRALICCLNS